MNVFGDFCLILRHFVVKNAKPFLSLTEKPTAAATEIYAQKPYHEFIVGSNDPPVQIRNGHEEALGPADDGDSWLRFS